jgi:SAM-dependent methyltransferase
MDHDPGTRRAGHPALPADTLSSVLRLWDEPDEEFVRGLYDLLLRRGPGPAELDFCLARLRRGVARPWVVRHLARSAEAAAAGVDPSWLAELRRLRPEGWRSTLTRLALGLHRRAAGLVRRGHALCRLPEVLWQAVSTQQELVRQVASMRQELFGQAALAELRQLRQEQQARHEEAGRHLHAAAQQLRDVHFEHAARFEQLRKLGSDLSSRLAPPAPEEGATPAPDACPACRVCGGPLAFRWRLRVLHDRYTAEYHECLRCAALQVPHPTWLPEAYRGEGRPRFWTPDGGRFVRNFSVYSYLCALRDAGLISAGARLLDFGGGYGLLTQMLVSGGYDAWQADPYVAAPFFAPDRYIPDLGGIPPASFDVVTAFEVFEHLTDPRSVLRDLRRVLRDDGCVVLSTGVYEPGAHGPDWHYLAAESGQHVTFWSRAALGHLAAEFGFRSIGYWPGGQGFTVILSPLPPEALEAITARADEQVRGPAFWERITRPWDLRHFGYGSAAGAPVEPARLRDEARRAS